MIEMPERTEFDTAESQKSPAPTGADTRPALAIGDTLTVVTGRIGGAWMVEDEAGTVYTATPVE